MQCDFVFAYLRLSRDDKEKMEESNSIKNQRLLIQHFVENQPEFAGAKLFFFVDDGYSGTTFDRPEFKHIWFVSRRRQKKILSAKRMKTDCLCGQFREQKMAILEMCLAFRKHSGRMSRFMKVRTIRMF